MGVPGFFSWLLRNYDQKKVILQKLPDDVQADYLFLDSNCFLHPQHFALLAYYEKVGKTLTREVLVKKMIKRCLSYLDFLMDYTDPRVKVVVSIDGVAPMAKMNQQRVRRFKSMYDNTLKESLRKTCGVSVANNWSNTVITPGTVDMENLHRAIIDHINKRKDRRIEYSSYHTKGEGEHKIMEEIRSYPKGEEPVIVIYGLDADLIFLSKALGLPNIYLLRESRNLGRYGKSKKKPNYDMMIDPTIEVEEDLEYVSIDETKNSLFDKFAKMVKKQNEALELTKQDVDKDRLVYDFIFLCFFLGNDFLPHIPSIDINRGGMDLLFDGYVKTYVMVRSHLVSTKPIIEVNMIFLEELLRFMAKREDYYFMNILPEHRKKESEKKIIQKGSIFEKKWEEIESMQKFKNLPDHIKLGEDHSILWKARYYEEYFDATDHQDSLVGFLCRNYLDGLVWTLKYYFEGCQSWSWFYPELHAPFISDLFYYIKSGGYDLNKVKFEDLGPAKPVEQLLAVLPPSCSDLLPKSYKHLMHEGSPVEDFYPVGFELDYHDKDLFWKCIPRITCIDVKRLRSELVGLKLTSDEKVRNETLEPIRNYKE